MVNHGVTTKNPADVPATLVAWARGSGESSDTSPSPLAQKP